MTLLSVHASPNTVTGEWLSNWPGDVDRPEPRSGGEGVRNAGRRWDADMVLGTILHTADRGPVLAAGDLNESRTWDDLHPDETWGREFFERVDARLVDCLHGRLPADTVTHWAPNTPSMQIDHVFASRDVASFVTSADAPSLDEAWGDPRAIESNDLSDHAPIWFSLAD